MFFGKELNSIVISVLFPIVGYAQSAIVAGGGDVFTGAGSASCTIGQVDYLSVSSTQSGVVSAGMQQAFVKVKEETPTGDWIVKQVRMSVFPNPTQDRCQLTVENCSGRFQYVITDLVGKTYATGEASNGTWIPFENFMYGTYLLKITQGKDIVVTFKIIKE